MEWFEIAVNELSLKDLSDGLLIGKMNWIKKKKNKTYILVFYIFFMANALDFC